MECKIANGALDPSKIYILLQHDVDTRPERSMRLVDYERSKGVRSNVMIFNRRVNRRKLAATGELEYTEYDLDISLLQKAEAEGFVVGYHSNAFEQSKYNRQQAEKLFISDLNCLRENFKISFFSAHGGT